MQNLLENRLYLRTEFFFCLCRATNAAMNMEIEVDTIQWSQEEKGIERFLYPLNLTLVG